MITIREVAEQANVSISTVSHVINKTRFVSQETQARVLAAMEDLNYRPNRLARSLRDKEMRTHTFGLLIPNGANPFFAELSRGVEDACFEAKHNLIFCNSDSDPTKEIEYLKDLTSKQVDGILFVSVTGNPEVQELVKDQGTPMVMVDREFEEISLDSVVIDNQRGGYAAVQYLLDLGHRQIGCISGPSILRPSAGRVHGYERALTNADIAVEETLIVSGDFRPGSGYEAAEKLLALDSRPTAIFACNDLMAMGALCALHEEGLVVPDDVSVIGFDDIDLASYTVPRLTTVAQPHYEMGRRAVEMLVNRIEEPASPLQRETLETSLLVRASCKELRDGGQTDVRSA